MVQQNFDGGPIAQRGFLLPAFFVPVVVRTCLAFRTTPFARVGSAAIVPFHSLGCILSSLQKILTKKGGKAIVAHFN
jgi:hypothetical protein